MKKLIPFAAAALGLALAGCLSFRPPGSFLDLVRDGSEQAVTEAIAAGANTNERDGNTGRTALMLAAWHNARPKVITALVKAGADFAARDYLGMTALMYAAVYSRSPKVIEALLEAGADGNALSDARKNAYHLCLQEA